MRTRLESAFDHFLDVAEMPDAAIAQLLRECEIDEQTAENNRADVGQLGEIRHEHREALLGREERTFAGVLSYGYGYVIK